MTDQTTTPTPATEAEQTTPEQLEAVAEETNTEDIAEEQQAETNLGAEAAKWRRKLRDTEAQLQDANARTEAAQRALAEHLAKQERIRPAALWASGVTLADLLDADGNVDPARINQAANYAVGELGLTRNPKPDLSQGLGSPSWIDGSHSFEFAFTPQS